MWSNNLKHLLNITSTNTSWNFALLFCVGWCNLLSASVQMSPDSFIHTNICKTFVVWIKYLFAQKFIWVKTLFIILHSLSILVVFHFKNNQISSKGMDTIPMWLWWQIVYKQWLGEMISAWISPTFICINYLVNI